MKRKMDRPDEPTDKWAAFGQTSKIVLPPAVGDPWERIETRAREQMAHKGLLYWAVESMIREQSWQKPATAGTFGDGIQCDHCAHLATHVWKRTEKELRSMRGRKVKGAFMAANAEAYACETHLPYWRVSNYARLVQGAAVKVA